MSKKHKDENPVSPAQLKEQVELQKHSRTSITVYGGSGCGKTTIMEQAASHCFDEVWLSNFSGRPPMDQTGLGLPEWNDKPDGGKILEMIFSQPEKIPTIDRVGDKHIYWLWDEVGNWDKELRAAGHGVLAPPSGGHRYLGTHIIGPNVVVGTTSNRRCDGATVGKFSIPESRRGIIMTLIPDPGDWWRWGDSIPEYAGTHVPSFIAYGTTVGAKQDHQNHFLGDPEDFDPYVPNAQPCPRTWEEVMKNLIIRKKGLCSRDACATATRGLVGSKATQALTAYLSVVDGKISFDEMKANPKGFMVPKEEMKQFVLASGAMLYATSGIADIPEALHSGEFDWVFDSMERFSPEVAAYGLATAERRGIDVPSRRPKLWADLVGA